MLHCYRRAPVLYVLRMQSTYSNRLCNLRVTMLPLQQAERRVGKGIPPTSDNVQVARNRGRIDVVAEIVHCCERSSSKSRIMMVANVNSVIATKIIVQLVETGLLDSVHERNSVHYMATPKGVDFVRKYWDLVSLLSAQLIPSKASNGNRLESLIF